MLGLSSLEKRREDLVAAVQYLKVAYRKEGNNLACCNRTRDNKLKEAEFRLDRRKTFFKERVMKPWDR